MKIDGGSPSNPTPIDDTNTAGPVETPSGPPQPTATSAAEETPTQPAPNYNPSGLLAEHHLTGQMRAMMFKTGGFRNAGGGGTAPPAPPRTISEGSQGADVQEAENQINQWRADTGKKPIKADGKFDDQTAAAVRDFQRHNELDPDGKIGPNTRDRLTLENDTAFKSLSPDTKKQVRDQMKGYSKDQAARDNLRQLATDPNFAKLTPEAQQHALKTLSSKPQDAGNLGAIRNNVRNMATLESNEKFKALDDLTKKTIRERMEKFENKPVERSRLMELATDDNLGKLGRANQHRVLEALNANPTSESNLGNLKMMIGSRSGFQKMDEGQKGTVLDLAIKNAGNETYVANLAVLTSHPKFGAMNPVDKGKTLNVFTETTPKGRAALQGLLQREIYGVPALLTHGVNPGSPSLLDQLDRLSSTPLDARLTDPRGKLVPHSQITEQLLEVVSDPGNAIFQARGTCTPTTVAHGLATTKPAEYARLATDLATTGSAKLANGDTISVPGRSAWMSTPPSDIRTDPERLIQSSMMDYARPGKEYVNYNIGPDGRYATADDGFVNPSNPKGPRSMDGWPDRPHSGLNPGEGKRVLDGIYNKSFEPYAGEKYSNDEKQDMMNGIRGALGRGSPFINAGIRLGEDGHHTVEISKVDHGRVYFRNPWGTNGVGRNGSIHGTKDNDTYEGPLRRTENGNQGEESMSIDDFKEALELIYR